MQYITALRMNMKEIIVRAVVVAVVSVVIGSMTKGVAEEKKAVKEGKTYSRYVFEIKYDKGLQIFMIVGFLFFAILFLIGVGNLCWGWIPSAVNSVGATAWLGAYAVFCLASVLGVCVWKIDVNGEEIIYRNYFGIKRKYNFKELEVYVNKKDKIYAYKNKKKVFTIDNNLPAGVHFMVRACEYGVCTMEE